jgi:hypothetical protein
MINKLQQLRDSKRMKKRYDIIITLNLCVCFTLSLNISGQWNKYSWQPTKFIATWIRMATVMRAKAPKAALVWSPNPSVGYPFGVVPELSPEDMVLLDTNGNGKVDNLDDPYTPYWYV